jgi:hypothetical protein
MAMVISVGLVSCGKYFDTDDTQNKPTEEKTIGTHIFNNEKTDKSIVLDGKCDYKIVVPNGASTLILTAAEELQLFFNEATGINLKIIDDTGLTYSETDKYFSLGDTSVSKSAGVSVDKSKLERKGVRIQTKGASVFLQGVTDYGVINGVYTLLEDLFHFDYFFEDSYSLDRNVKNLELKKYDILDNPDYENSFAIGANLDQFSPLLLYRKRETDLAYDGRLRLTTWDNGRVVPGVDGVMSRFYLDYEKYKDTHSDWYVPTVVGGNEGASYHQMCFTAHGNDAEYQAMVNELTEILKASFIMDRTGYIVAWGGADDNTCCTCKWCAEKTEQYGSATGQWIALANQVKSNVDAWMASDEGKEYARDWELLLLSYLAYQYPPVKYDGQGVAYATITCQDGVIPWYAPIQMDWTKPLEHKANAKWKKSVDEWSLVSDEFAFWGYTYFRENYLTPCENFYSLRQNMITFHNMGHANGFFLNGMGNGLNTYYSGWSMFKEYLYAKLKWNLNYTVGELLDKWCNGVYGGASAIMKKTFQSIMAQLKTIENQGFSGNYQSMEYYVKENFPRAKLQLWLDNYDYALLVAKSENADEVTQKMIRAERVFCYYALVDFYGADMTEKELSEYKTNFISEYEALNFEQRVGRFTEFLNVKNEWNS